MTLKRIDKGYGGQLVEECFCKDTAGHIYWTNGQQYISDGCAPGRIETCALYRNHGLIMEYSWPENLRLATPDETKRFCTNLVSHLEEEIGFTQEKCEKRVKLLRAEIETWKARIKKTTK